MDSHDLNQRLLFFLSDMLHASDNERALARLFPHDEFYLPEFYFLTEERTSLLSTHSEGTTLCEVLSKFLAKKTNNSQRVHICTSHDLFPVFCSFFKVKKGFSKNKNFQRSHEQFFKKKEKIKIESFI